MLKLLNKVSSIIQRNNSFKRIMGVVAQGVFSKGKHSVFTPPMKQLKDA